jgi:hypothetical protein
MPPFVLPTFNLNCNIWRNATWSASYPPIVPAADVFSPCNLAMSKRFQGGESNLIQLLLPALTDVRDGIKEQDPTTFGDVVEVPAGSGRYYYVIVVDDIGKGFLNEHRCASIEAGAYAIALPVPAWPVPYP